MKVTFNWLEENDYDSVTDYCRDLVRFHKNDPDYLKNETIEVYRGDMLCLTVSDIEKAATLQPVSCRWQKYDRRREEGSVEAQGAI